MNRHRHIGIFSFFLCAIIVLSATTAVAAAKKTAIPLAIKKIYFEYNSTASALGDLGVHVFLDGEDWKELKIVNPKGRTIFEVEGKGPYKELGMTELFFEGAEPDLADVPLQELLDRFPAGDYKFLGKTVDGERIVDTAPLTHAIPAGPLNVSAQLGPDNALVISWDRVTGPPNGFPNEPINIVAYQVIVSAFQVTVPATSAQRQSVTVSPEFVGSLAPGAQPFEVLAIEAGGNQTITEGSFIKP
jgi:hypothetical protein